MQVKNDDFMEQLGQILPFIRKDPSISEPGAQGSFSSILEDLARQQSGAATTDLNSLDKEQLMTLVRMMSLRMNYNAMSSLGSLKEGSEDESSSPFSLLSSLSPSPVPGNIDLQGIRSRNIGTKSSSQSSGGTDFNSIIDRASETYHVDKGLIRSVIMAESGFEPDATSPKGAMGLMQLMPDTARGLGVKNAYDPEENIMAGTRYLKFLMDRYDGNVPLALAAYNWGMGNVERGTGRYPEETRNYVTRIMKSYRQGSA